MPRTPVYSQIVQLRKQLFEENSVNKRREIVEELLSTLRNAPFRRRLVLEVAIPKDENRVVARQKRHSAVSEIWQVLLKTSIKYVRVVMSGRAKLHISDALVPFEMLKLWNMPVFDNEPPTLSKQTTKELLQYCLDMLDDAPSLGVEQLEEEMLTMLAYICDRKEFVTHFRPDQQISVILEEVEGWLMADDLSNALQAATVFCNLLETAGDVGIGLHLLISGALSMVSKWTSKKIDNIEMIVLLLRGVNVLLESHPDLSVAPMARYGKPVVSLAKRCLGVTNLLRQKAKSMLRFLTNYVKVCQIAGKIQGTMLGDLGDLGAASLSYKNICYLIESLFRMTDVPDDIWKDLIVRLLACGQRLYLCRLQWVELDDPFKSLENELEREKRNDYDLSIGSENRKEINTCSFQDLAESPFAHFILNHFGLSKANHSPGNNRSATVKDTTWHRVIPYLSDNDMNERSLVPRLQVLTAAVELFPLGACWATDTMSNWIAVDKEMGDFRDSLLVQGGSIEELSSIIDIVGSVLERTGTNVNFSKLQSPALVCLVRLVEASTVNFNVRSNSARSFVILRDALSRIWSILFSFELVFAPLTKSCKPNSIGDYVLRLSQQIICYPGFDNDQIRRMQLDLWNLPAFSAYSTKNPAVFWLIYSMLTRVELVADRTAEDSIMQTEFLFSSFPRPVDRNARLLLFCVSHFHYVDQIEDDDVLTAVSMCLSALLRASSNHIQSTPVVSWLSRMHRMSNQCPVLASIPMTRGEDVFRTLWTAYVFDHNKDHVDVFGEFDYVNHDMFCSLTFFLTKLPKNHRQSELVPNMNGFEWFFSGFERLFRDMIRRRDDEEMVPRISDTGLLRLLKIFTFVAMGNPRRVAQAAEFYGSVIDRVDIGKLTIEDQITFVKLSSQIARALIKMDYSAMVYGFPLAFSALKDYATTMLTSITLSSDFDTSGSAAPIETRQTPGPLYEDVIMRDIPTTSGKRKAESLGESPPPKRQFHQKSDFPPTFEFIYLLSSLLMTLCPTMDMIGIISEALTGVDLTIDQSDDIVAIDVEGCKSLIKLLCRDLLFVDRGEEDNGRQTIATFVLKAIQIIRSKSPPEANSRLYGFDICKLIVEGRDGFPTAKNLGMCEVGAVIDLLDAHEKKILSSRPKFRLQQIATSASVFGKAQSLLHAHFDSFFTTKLLSPFLLDINTAIRSNVAFAIGLALQKLDKRVIIESVRKELKPIVGSLDAYQKWYSRKLGKRDTDSIRERQLFEDAREGFVFDAISTYWVVAGVSCKDPELVEQMIFDYVWLAAMSPELQSLCFQSIDRMARLLGFTEAENLLFSHQRSISHRWLATKESLFEMPILFTAPSVLRRLIRLNRGKSMHDTASEESLAYERLSDFAASRFLELAIDDFVPRIVASACEEIVESAITTDGRRLLLQNEYLRQISSIFFDQYDDEMVRNLLKKSLPALNVEKIILFHQCDEKLSMVSRQLELLLDRLISDPSATPRASIGDVVKKMIQITGGPGGMHTINLSSVLQDIGKHYERGHVRPIEFLFFAYYRLLCAPSEIQRILRWQPMEQICSFICGIAQSDADFCPSVSFGLKLLSDCLRKTELAFLHPLVCSSINGLLVVATKLADCGENLSVVLRDLLENTIELHYSHQQDILANHTRWHEYRERAVAAKNGLLRKQEDSDAWGWKPLQNKEIVFLAEVDENTRLAMKGTFDLTNLLVSEHEKLKLSPQAIVGIWRRFEDKNIELTNLGLVHQDFAAQMVLKQFSIKKDAMNYDIPDASVIESSNEGMLKAELEQLERSLNVRNVRNVLDDDLSSQLVQSLIKVSSQTTDHGIRDAASRCLGELSNFPLKHQQGQLVKLDEISILKMQFFAILQQSARTLMKLRAKTMYVAVDCFKSLSATLRGKVSTSLEERFPEVEALTAVIPASDDNHFNRTNLLLSDVEINRLFGRLSDRNDLWCWDRSLWSHENGETESFEQWICRITLALLVCLYSQAALSSNSVSSMFLVQCQKLSCLDAFFAREVFKLISLHLMLSDKDDFVFKNNPRDQVIEGFTEGLKLVLESYEEIKDRRYIETVIDVLDTLRHISQERFLKDPSKTKEFDSRKFEMPFNIFSGLDGLLVASACVKVKLFQQALFYVELYATENFKPTSVLDEKDCMSDQYRCYLRVMYESYQGLRQNDSCSAVEDCQSTHSFSNFRGENYVRVQDFGLHRLEKVENQTLIENTWSSHLSLLECLSDMDLNATLGKYLESLEKGLAIEDDKISDRYVEEKAAEVRLYKRQWDDSCFETENVTGSNEIALPSQRSSQCRTLGFYGSIDKAFDFLRREDLGSYKNCICNARSSSIDELVTNKLQMNDVTLNFYLKRFNILNRLDLLGRDPTIAASLLRINSPRSKAIAWLRRSFRDDDVLESAVRSLPPRLIDSTLKDCILDHLEVKFEDSISCGERKRSHGILSRLRSLHLSKGAAGTEDFSSMVRLRLKEARLLEQTDDFHAAIRLAKLTAKICMNGSFDVHTWLECDQNAPFHCRLPLLAEAMTLCGIWTAKYRVEPSTLILSYQRAAVVASRAALTLTADKNSTRILVQAYCAQAELASSLFESSKRRRQSTEWQEAGATLIEREETLKNLTKKGKRPQKNQNQDHFRYARELTREVEATRRSREEFEESIESYRFLSMHSSVLAMSVANTNYSRDLSKFMYSFISLLFSCAEDHKWSNEIDALATKASRDIPSYRFVGLFSQLLSRLEANTDEYQKLLSNHLIQIVHRVSSDHPFHCIMQLIALSKSPKSRKAEAATKILADLSKSGPGFLDDIICNQRDLFDAYVYLALANSDEFQRGTSQKISFDNIYKGSSPRLDRIPGICSRTCTSGPCVLTKIPDLRPDCEYGKGETDPIGSERIKGFESHFTIASSGLSRPKIVVCLGTKGGRFKQLVKGGDDTRQDAVMEQVFQYVNTLLHRQRGSSYQGQLCLVTYNVIPLTPIAGVLEWVDHCAGFSHYISGKSSKSNCRRRIPTMKSGAHERYFPHEWSIEKCNELLSDPQNKRRLREVYDEVCRNFSPVYRFFFVEKFGHSAELWYQAKLRYTRSVATSSIVGHVLGIGDRHGSNIMMHQQTGEVIHIDFGIVFEQGKRLQRPEKVPFRLTRNVVDGMGPLGTQGVFTTAAETTLELLKDNSNALLTILSAIVNDPLYRWTLGASSKKTSSTVVGRNAAAALAISRIQEKLQGYEEGTHGEQQTITSQVQLLVNEAMDPDNLCEMYCGWGPHF